MIWRIALHINPEAWAKQAHRLRSRREQAGISLRGFSRMLRTTSSYWSKVERGEATPGADTLIAAMRHLNMPANSFGEVPSIVVDQ